MTVLWGETKLNLKNLFVEPKGNFVLCQFPIVLRFHQPLGMQFYVILSLSEVLAILGQYYNMSKMLLCDTVDFHTEPKLLDILQLYLLH